MPPDPLEIIRPLCCMCVTHCCIKAKYIRPACVVTHIASNKSCKRDMQETKKGMYEYQKSWTLYTQTSQPP